jgi:trk system potassium uptake protein TrkA
MRILILGCQGAGLHLAPVLAKQGHQVVAIDADPDLVGDLSACENVEGRLYREPMLDSLREAGLSNADAFMALTDSDSRNGMAAQVAQTIFHIPKVFCSIRDPHRQKVYEKLGLTVINPTMALVDGITSGLEG